MTRKGGAAYGTDPEEVAREIAARKAAIRKADIVNESGVVRLSTVAPRRLRWLWPGRIPAGKITMLDGDPNVGKSTIALDLAARVTTGGPWPDGTKCPTGTVLIMTAEDALADTVRPRIELANGDARKVLVLTYVPGIDPAPPRLPTLPADTAHIGRIITAHQVKLLIIDVLDSYLGAGDAKVNAYRSTDVRQALYPLAVMAEQTCAAVLPLRHLNKAASLANPMYRGIGSIGITGQARAVHLAALDPDDPSGERRILCPVKLNVGELPPSLGYTLIAGYDGDHATVKWLGEDQHTAAQLLAAQLEEAERADRDETASWVQSYLFHAGGEASYADMLAASRKHGIPERTLKRSKDRAGVSFRRAGWQKGTIWVLNPRAMAAIKDEQADPGAVIGAIGASLMSMAPMAPMELPGGWYRLTFEGDRAAWTPVPEHQALAEIDAGEGNDLVRKRIIPPREANPWRP